ncbi:N-acetylmuramidase domain-containing protein, partial [Pseudomonas chlororaphis]
TKDWAVFAAAYNGPDYAKNQYNIRLATAYSQHCE